MKVIAICNLPDGIKLDHAWFTAEDGLYAQKVVIRPLPKMAEVFDDAYVSDYLDFDLGWNACLKEITGETE